MLNRLDQEILSARTSMQTSCRQSEPVSLQGLTTTDPHLSSDRRSKQLVKVLVGDLFDSKAQTQHTVNCVGVMGKQVAQSGAS